MRGTCVMLTLLLAAADCGSAVTGPASEPLVQSASPSVSRHGRIELIRDTWGVPHVFAETDEGAMYGLGYACAEDRAFQMHYSLRIIQGRLAEVVGDRPSARRDESALFSDRKMRTFGFYRAAKAASDGLDADAKAMLRAYCDGVNDYIAAHGDTLHPLFEKLGLKPEPWTPADCIASFWHLGQFFAGDGTRELIHYRSIADGSPTRPAVGRDGRPMTRPTPSPLWMDDESSVVLRSDVSDDWLKRVNDFLRLKGLSPAREPATGPAGPKFSHAWVVGGKKTTTGSAVLVSDPQTPIRCPSLWQEFHVSGKTFNARGVGVPGCPGLLIGWNENVAWGASALGADQADLFRLQTDANHPDRYFLDGKWRDMAVRRETLAVKNGQPIELLVRETLFGPVVTAFAFAIAGDPQVALKRVPVCSNDSGTFRAMLAMMRAKDADGFARAISTWQFPSLNLVFGDKKGDVGYWLLAAIPVRSALDTQQGAAAVDGTRSEMDWQGFVPHDLLPHVINPARGWIASANHRAIGSFYPALLGLSTGSGGHTTRSWRLYERLGTRERFEPNDVLDIHFDTVNSARREIVHAGLHLRDVRKRELSPDATEALKRLEGWYAHGAKSELDQEGAELAGDINTFFRLMSTPLAGTYGGGESGLSRFLRDVQARIARDPNADLSREEQQFIDQALAGAWQSARKSYGDDPGRWNARARAAVTARRIGSFDSLDGFGSLDPRSDLTVPALTCVDGGTIKSQAGQSYTQYVPLNDVDSARSLLPPGASELPDSPWRTSSVDLWRKGDLHPAPLSRQAVEKIASSRQVLTPAPGQPGATRPGATRPSPTSGPAPSPAAMLEPPAGRVVHGMGQWEQYNAKLLKALPAEVQPAAELIFIQIGDSPRGWRPQGVSAALRRYDDAGFIPVLDIGLRGNQPTQAVLKTMPDPLFGIDHEVAAGTRFDERIRDLAKAVREFGRPVMVRIGGEFSGWWNGYHPYAYPKAFRKIVGMFREANVANAAFVWCYEPAAPGDFDERNAQGEHKWFPGVDVIDWFSIDWFNREDFTGPLLGGRDGNALTAHGRSRKFLDMAVANRKPVIIAESAPSRYDLTDPNGAQDAWREWFEPYFQIIAERPEIKWFHLISYDWTRASYFAQQGWKNNDLTASPALLEKLVAELKKPRYLHSDGKSLLRDYPRIAATATSHSATASHPAGPAQPSAGR